MTAEAETEFASLDCVLGEELLLSSDIVGMEVGVDAEAQALKISALSANTIKQTFFIRVFLILLFW